MRSHSAAAAAAAVTLAALVGGAHAQNISCSSTSSLYTSGFSFALLNGTTVNLSSYAGQVLLITNVASF